MAEIEKIFGINSTSVSMNERFSAYMKLPVRYRIVPINPHVEWTNRTKSKGIIRGRLDFGNGYSNPRWNNNYMGQQNRRWTPGRGGRQNNRQNSNDNNVPPLVNNNTWKWQKRGGRIMKRWGQRRGQYNGYNNRRFGYGSSAPLPSKEDLDKELDDYMMTSGDIVSKKMEE